MRRVQRRASKDRCKDSTCYKDAREIRYSPHPLPSIFLLISLSSPSQPRPVLVRAPFHQPRPSGRPPRPLVRVASKSPLTNVAPIARSPMQVGLGLELYFVRNVSYSVSLPRPSPCVFDLTRSSLGMRSRLSTLLSNSRLSLHMLSPFTSS
jgi:hypothetical protein